jgi:hypothetical protein
VEEDGVKSAFELAMEKVSGLPELTPEEIAEQKEREYRTIGEGLSYRYLQDAIDAKSLVPEMEKHPGDSGRIVRRAFISGLCDSIQLEDVEAAGKALKGLRELAEDREDFLKNTELYWDILGSYERQVKERFQEFENVARDDLARLGISGSAIRPNLMENESVKKGLADLRHSFEPELKKLRGTVMQKMQDIQQH